MKFLNLQKHTWTLAKAGASTKGVPAGNVVKDIGFSRDYVAGKLDVGDALDDTKPGCVVIVYPSTRGHNIQKTAAGTAPVDCVVSVRFEFNPKQLQMIEAKYQVDFLADPDTATPDASEWMAGIINAVVSAILGDAPSPGGQRYEANDVFFELLNFDEGLIAYNLWFTRLAVF